MQRGPPPGEPVSAHKARRASERTYSGIYPRSRQLPTGLLLSLHQADFYVVLEIPGDRGAGHQPALRSPVGLYEHETEGFPFVQVLHVLVPL